MMFYIALCLFVMILVKYFMVSIRFSYVFLDQCANIDQMFANRDDYLQWATLDKQY